MILQLLGMILKLLETMMTTIKTTVSNMPPTHTDFIAIGICTGIVFAINTDVFRTKQDRRDAANMDAVAAGIYNNQVLVTTNATNATTIAGLVTTNAANGATIATNATTIDRLVTTNDKLLTTNAGLRATIAAGVEHNRVPVVPAAIIDPNNNEDATTIAGLRATIDRLVTTNDTLVTALAPSNATISKLLTTNAGLRATIAARVEHNRIPVVPAAVIDPKNNEEEEEEKEKEGENENENDVDANNNTVAPVALFGGTAAAAAVDDSPVVVRQEMQPRTAAAERASRREERFLTTGTWPTRPYTNCLTNKSPIPSRQRPAAVDAPETPSGILQRRSERIKRKNDDNVDDNDGNVVDGAVAGQRTAAVGPTETLGQPTAAVVVVGAIE